jgi:iron complex transport system permease protein
VTIIVAAGDSYGLARRRQRRVATFLALLAGLLAVAFVASAGIGAVAIPLDHLLAILAAKLGLAPSEAVSERESLVLLSIRLPRVVLAVMVGAALACCGAVQQGLFQNPLADPGLLGTSSGAAVAAAATIVLGHSFTAQLPPLLLPYLLPVAAFGGALIATVFIYLVASRGGTTDVSTMLLAGVGVNAISMSGIGLLIFASSDRELRDLNYWMLGSLGGATWTTLVPALLLVIPSLVGLLALTRPLNALLLGEGEAQHLGFDIERIKRFAILFTALVTGASVALTGIIGFVGLVVPHLVRLIIGADHRNLLPSTILLGTSLVLVADLISRLIVLPAELPIGIVTSFIGAPVFIWLLLMRQRGGI